MAEEKKVSKQRKPSEGWRKVVQGKMKKVTRAERDRKRRMRGEDGELLNDDGGRRGGK